MQQIFIELYNYRPAWAKCPESERTDFAKKVVEAPGSGADAPPKTFLHGQDPLRKCSA
jgi:hypothetical protein